jgi:hypothetical protein
MIVVRSETGGKKSLHSLRRNKFHNEIELLWSFWLSNPRWNASVPTFFFLLTTATWKDEKTNLKFDTVKLIWLLKLITRVYQVKGSLILYHTTESFKQKYAEVNLNMMPQQCRKRENICRWYGNGLQAGWSRFNYWQGQIFVFFTTSRPVLGPTKPRI